MFSVILTDAPDDDVEALLPGPFVRVALRGDELIGFESWDPEKPRWENAGRILAQRSLVKTGGAYVHVWILEDHRPYSPPHYYSWCVIPYVPFSQPRTAEPKRRTILVEKKDDLHQVISHGGDGTRDRQDCGEAN